MSEKCPHLLSRVKRSGQGALRGRGVVMLLMVAAIGFGAGQAAQFGWRDAGDSLDQAMWQQALKDRPAATRLDAASPVWRERKGASGDKIVERIDRTQRVDAGVAVLDEVGGKVISAQVLAERAATADSDGTLAIQPANFSELTAGDRLTITTGDGQVRAFEIVSETGADARQDDHPTPAVRIIAPAGGGSFVVYAVQPVEPQAGALSSQQDL